MTTRILFQNKAFNNEVNKYRLHQQRWFKLRRNQFVSIPSWRCQQYSYYQENYSHSKMQHSLTGYAALHPSQPSCSLIPKSLRYICFSSSSSFPSSYFSSSSSLSVQRSFDYEASRYSISEKSMKPTHGRLLLRSNLASGILLSPFSMDCFQHRSIAHDSTIESYQFYNQLPIGSRTLSNNSRGNNNRGRNTLLFSSTTPRLLYHSTKSLSVSQRSSFRNSSSSSSQQQPPVLSPRQLAAFEEYIYEKVGTCINDPVLVKSLNELGWLNKRIAVSSRISDNNSNKTIISVSLLLKLPSLLHPQLDDLKKQVHDAASLYIQEWFDKNYRTTTDESAPKGSTTIDINVEVIGSKPYSMMSKLVDDPEELLNNLGPGLSSISHIIAVYSCKGGVGKSTIAVNLAYELKSMGGRVGLLDLDLYGPSIPVLIKPNDTTIRRSNLGKGMVYPINHEGIKVLSLGYVNQQSGVQGSGSNNGASIMKGPMAVKVVSQLLKSTDWGDLDVLILDLPPGTGDIQLGVLQEIQMTGAVAVTTPSKLAIVDTKKGIEMFSSLGVPTLAIVENMSYFEDDTGKKHYPFGKGFVDTNNEDWLATQQNRSLNVIQLPISVSMSDANESGVPLTLDRTTPNTEKELLAYQSLAHVVSRELLRLQYGHSNDDETVFVSFGEKNERYDVNSVSLTLSKSNSDDKLFVIRLFSDSGAVQQEVKPSELRGRDPRTGDKIPHSPFGKEESNDGSNPSSTDSDVIITNVSGKRKVSPSIIPSTVARRGRYGFAVVWQDGATIIYSNQCIAVCAGGTVSHLSSKSST